MSGRWVPGRSVRNEEKSFHDKNRGVLKGAWMSGFRDEGFGLRGGGEGRGKEQEGDRKRRGKVFVLRFRV